MQKYFRQQAQPPCPRDKTQGTLTLSNGRRLWKHAFPTDVRSLHQGRTLVLITARELVSWLHALGDEAYEIFPSDSWRVKTRKPKRPRGDL